MQKKAFKEMIKVVLLSALIFSFLCTHCVPTYPFRAMHKS